ncbi:hypothetical protein EV646_11672 [Kribbella antiqua]|uniref:Lipoprotein n=1 Tax=Kribbella antiqua TaxID=2512217 RepID=A0A4R2I990_9ACTN|nr:hypothetical protein [Kribbella antiqua]TCO40981.1 hypothetical protein EV646_11672 [Kribbella antiqua]
MKRITALAVVLVLAGCSTVDSKDIRTSGITADLLVSLPEDTDAADVTASLRVGTLTFVELGDGEDITASGAGKTVQLKHRRSAGATDYRNRLDGVVAPGTEITFDLERSGDDTSAPKSTIALPARVRLTAPASGTTYSRRQAIDVRFTSEPSQAGAILSWAGECVTTGSLQLEGGRTSVTIPAGSITPSMATPTPGVKPTTTCPINLTLTRRDEGTLDPAFKNGTIAAETQSTRRITSTP